MIDPPPIRPSPAAPRRPFAAGLRVVWPSIWGGLLLASVAGAGTQPTSLAVLHRSGQTFVTWTESVDASVESYRVYRYNQPIDAFNLGATVLLREVWEGSSEFYADRYYKPIPDTWVPRYLQRFVISDDGPELTAGTGLLVWTLAAVDLGGGTSGTGYYAVTAVDNLGVENVIDFTPANASGPVSEQVDFPAPVRVATVVGGTHEIYTQFMDLRSWNPTLDAPSPIFGYFGLNPADPGVQGSIQYAYNYEVVPPYAGGCADLGTLKPLILQLHGWGGHKARPATNDDDPTWCDAFRIYPIDVSNTWWFGFAQDHDYRTGVPPSFGETIENFTEQRVLRMVADLLRHPVYGPQIDPERIYVLGHSMGGSGTLALTLRYPDVFAASYASQPMTDHQSSAPTFQDDWVADATVKWGSPADNLPVAFGDTEGAEAHILPYVGTGVWDWQNHQANLTNRVTDPMVPFGVTHGFLDTVLAWSTQGAPGFVAYEASRQAWAGTVENVPHMKTPYKGLPPTMGEDFNGMPFAGFRVVLSESVPAFSATDTNPPIPPTAPGQYNYDVEWSASWNNFDGPPIDSGPLWGITLRSLDASAHFMDVTPRRLQTFHVYTGQLYSWQNRRVSDGTLVASGVVQGEADELCTVSQFEVSPGGNRLTLRPVLAGNVQMISVATGGVDQLDLVAGPGFGNKLYWMLGSASGTSPGIALGGGQTLPLNLDAYTQFTLSLPNSPLLVNSLSLLDPEGEAAASFALPPGMDPGLAGLVLDHAYVVLDSPGTGALLFVSSAVATVIVP